jgi:hypothetical protein
MNERYAYSYDREDYRGSYASPEEAFEAARMYSEGAATTIYVGVLVDADPQATDHAGPIIHAMRQRALVDIGDAARHYLKTVSSQQVKELDAALEQTILAWLRRNSLMPNFVRVQGIREFPVDFHAYGIHSSSSHQVRPVARFKLKETEMSEAWCCEGAD